MPPLERNRCIHVVTGKPIESGGSVGRDKATGQGIVFTLEAWAKDNDFDLGKATYIVQGFGNVGSWTARLLKPHGATLLAVEDHTGAIYNAAGIDPDALVRVCDCQQGRRRLSRRRTGGSQDVYEHAADIFVPAALENQITAETAPWLNVRLVAEGANGPTNVDGDQIVLEKGIELLPDVLVQCRWCDRQLLRVVAEQAQRVLGPGGSGCQVAQEDRQCLQARARYGAGV